MIASLRSEMTRHDVSAWQDDLLSRLQLHLIMDHSVISPDGRVESVTLNPPEPSPLLADDDDILEVL